MECYCEPSDGEPCEVWQTSWRKARKSHQCCECGEPITPGGKYEYLFTVFEGQHDTFKTCEFCANEFERLRIKHSDICMCKTELACILVWDIRGETDHATGK